MVLDTVLGVLLAGGLSSRMGTNKALLSFGGRTLLARTWALLTSCLSHCVVSARSDYAGYPVLLDASGRIGPVGAIATALSHAERAGLTAVLALACDMPFLDAAIVRHLLSAWDGKSLAVFFRRADGRCEPLCALYACAGLPYFEAAIAGRTYALRAVLPEESVQYLSCPAAWEESFCNVNTPEEARLALEKEKGLSEIEEARKN